MGTACSYTTAVQRCNHFPFLNYLKVEFIYSHKTLFNNVWRVWLLWLFINYMVIFSIYYLKISDHYYWKLLLQLKLMFLVLTNLNRGCIVLEFKRHVWVGDVSSCACVARALSGARGMGRRLVQLQLVAPSRIMRAPSELWINFLWIDDQKLQIWYTEIFYKIFFWL
jgi:hypothetical protein